MFFINPSSGSTAPDALRVLSNPVPPKKSGVVTFQNDQAEELAFLRQASGLCSAFYGIQSGSDHSQSFALIEITEDSWPVLSRDFLLTEAPGKCIFVMPNGIWIVEFTGGPVRRTSDFSLAELKGFEIYLG